MSEQRATADVAKLCGVAIVTIRKWRIRGDLPSSPEGRAGQGRGTECQWSEQAIQELHAGAAENRNGRYRKPAKFTQVAQ